MPHKIVHKVWNIFKRSKQLSENFAEIQFFTSLVRPRGIEHQTKALFDRSNMNDHQSSQVEAIDQFSW